MKIIPLKIDFKDARGSIVDMIENENINAVTLVTFTKDAIRGNHYHKATTQYNYLLKGKIRLVTQNFGEEKKSVVLEPGTLSIVMPMEKHALHAIEDSELLVFTKGPRGGKEYETDTFRLEEVLI
jgi:quercetin dioxygenase-like cupin family protein